MLSDKYMILGVGEKADARAFILKIAGRVALL